MTSWGKASPPRVMMQVSRWYLPGRHAGPVTGQDTRGSAVRDCPERGLQFPGRQPRAPALGPHLPRRYMLREALPQPGPVAGVGLGDQQQEAARERGHVTAEGEAELVPRLDLVVSRERASHPGILSVERDSGALLGALPKNPATQPATVSGRDAESPSQFSSAHFRLLRQQF